MIRGKTNVYQLAQRVATLEETTGQSAGTFTQRLDDAETTLGELETRVAQLEQSAANGVPVGAIVLTDEIDEFDLGTGLGNVGGAFEGWAIMDGRNNTADLTGRFVVGFDVNGYDADYATILNTGGESTVTLTAEQSGVPDHTHTYAVAVTAGTGTAGGRSATTGPDDETGGVAGGAQDASEPHENRPPYVVLLYAKKIA